MIILSLKAIKMTYGRLDRELDNMFRSLVFYLRITICFLSLCVVARPALESDQVTKRLPTSTELKARPGLIGAWSDRVLAGDPKVREKAKAELIRGDAESLPLLRGFLSGSDERLQKEALEIIRRIGAGALPLLTELLEWKDPFLPSEAVGILIDLAPDSEPAQPALARALNHNDPQVSRDAARALGALGSRAGPSVPDLTKALENSDPVLRLYAAEAIASVGPAGSYATNGLIKCLHDQDPRVRRAAGEALAALGPQASRAVPDLIDALKDEFLYVRICAAGALGSIGLKTDEMLSALNQAAADPAMKQEVEWALYRITGTSPRGTMESGAALDEDATPAASVPSRPTESPGHYAASVRSSPPQDWDIKSGRNIVWSAGLGNETFGRPVVSGSAVYVGSDNGRFRNKACGEECGVLMAFEVSTGAFLWQDSAPRLNRGTGDFLLPSTTSGPYVEGDRLYYVTAECQLRSLDTRGFRDGENDGLFKDEQFQDEQSADVIWELDMGVRLGVFPHEACNSDVRTAGGLLFVSTSNGRNEGHTGVPSPRAPSLIAVDKRSGEVVWRAIGPGENVLHGQWSSPATADVNGRLQVFFGGGDGWLRAYDAISGRELWKFDGNPPDAKWLPRPGVFSRSSIIASPVYADGRVFIAMGQDPSHGDGPSVVYGINANGQGNVTGSRILWNYRGAGRVIGTPVLKDGLLYVGDLGGVVHCLDAATGAVVWTQGTNAPIWGSLTAAGDRLYVGNTDGVMTVLRAGRRKQELARIEMDAPLYSRPDAVGDSLYVATAARLYRIHAKP
jgi:outer membrane protein assembly factor BamB/HEAT repeat protein